MLISLTINRHKLCIIHILHDTRAHQTYLAKQNIHLHQYQLHISSISIINFFSDGSLVIGQIIPEFSANLL